MSSTATQDAVTILSPAARDRLSLTLTEAGAGERLINYFVPRGVVCVGEMFLIPWFFLTTQNHSQGIFRRAVDDFLATLELPPQLDLRQCAWKAPYDTPELHALLNRRTRAILRPHSENNRNNINDLNRLIAEQQWIFGGDLLTKHPRQCALDFRRLQSLLPRQPTPLNPKLVHAGMWTSWVAPRG